MYVWWFEFVAFAIAVNAFVASLVNVSTEFAIADGVPKVPLTRVSWRFRVNAALKNVLILAYVCNGAGFAFHFLMSVEYIPVCVNTVITALRT